MAPLAERMQLKVEKDEALAEGASQAAVALVRRVANEKIALCTHGDVIPEILVSLADEDHLDLGPRPRQAKGSVWVLENEGDRFVKAVYLPPPARRARRGAFPACRSPPRLTTRCGPSPSWPQQAAARSRGTVWPPSSRSRPSSWRPSWPSCAMPGWCRAAGAPRAATGWPARPSRSRLADIIRAVDGPLASVRGQRPETVTYRGPARRLTEVWVALRASLRLVLEEVTLADLVAGDLPPAVRALAADPAARTTR